LELVRFKARALLSACFALVVVAYAAAQAPESESGAAAASSEQARLGEMFYRVQVLEQEVRELRGLLEEQAFQLERLSRQQKEHYIDLDGRLATLGGEVPGAATGSATTPREASRAGGLPRPERDAYSAAFDLMKEQRYQESSDAFNRLIADYPNGEYTPNAFYWLGELHLAMGEAEQAGSGLRKCWRCTPTTRRRRTHRISWVWSIVG